MINNKSLDTISGSIEALSRYATDLAEKYVIDSPAVALDKYNETFVRVGRWKTGKTLLYSPKGGDEDLLIAAPIMAKVRFMEIFEAFFETYAAHASRFWMDVDRAILKCEGSVSRAMDAVKMAEAKAVSDSIIKKIHEERLLLEIAQEELAESTRARIL